MGVNSSSTLDGRRKAVRDAGGFERRHRCFRLVIKHNGNSFFIRYNAADGGTTVNSRDAVPCSRRTLNGVNGNMNSWGRAD